VKICQVKLVKGNVMTPSH